MSKWIRYRYPNLKKSPKRKGGHSFEDEASFRQDHALPDLGAPGSQHNPHHRTEKHLEDIWHIELYGARFLITSRPFSTPRPYIDYLERTLRSYCSRKIYLIQDNASYHKRPHGVDLVFQIIANI